jgi:uncharacterized glyoxalase superfamily protein PhnB
MVEDVNQTIDYYRDIFGATLINTVPETGVYDWAMVTVGNVSLMFQSRESFSKEWPEFSDKRTGGTFGFYIQVNQIRDMYEKIKDRVHIIHGIAKAFYGATEFTMVDLNGYILTFSEDEE